MISVVILTKNEGKNIKDCIKTVLFADEIIVIDDHSDDDTVTLAKEVGALVYFHDLESNFAAQRNFGLGKASHEWVLFLDADERVSDALKQEMTSTLSQRRNRYSGYSLKRQDYLFGGELKYGETGSGTFLRLARINSGKWKGNVHETWNVSGHTAQLRNPLLHYPHPTMNEFLSEVNYYTTLRAQELYKQGIRAGFLSILFHTKGKFFQNYFLKLGILDGIPGIISAFMMSFHAFLVRSKLWLLWQKNTKTV